MTVPRRMAIYARVSSEDQAERGTIQTQIDELDRRLAHEPDVVCVGRYIDDGVSGTIPFGKRPEGGRLLRDAKAGRFDEVWVCNGRASHTWPPDAGGASHPPNGAERPVRSQEAGVSPGTAHVGVAWAGQQSPDRESGPERRQPANGLRCCEACQASFAA